jgi:hypothetical protein
MVFLPAHVKSSENDIIQQIFTHILKKKKVKRQRKNKTTTMNSVVELKHAYRLYIFKYEFN